MTLKLFYTLQKKLLELDNGTSQWASAAYLAGYKRRIPNPPPKLQHTYEAITHWRRRRAAGLDWDVRYDETIRRQFTAYMNFLTTGKMNFTPKHSEDYCFARAFDLITPEKGKKLWPQLQGHESNRIEHLEEVIAEADSGGYIFSNDHRVVQSVVMRQRAKGIPEKIGNLGTYQAVNKTCPEFWSFIIYGEATRRKSA